MNRGAWKATVNGVAKSQARLSDSHFHSFLLNQPKSSSPDYSHVPELRHKRVPFRVGCINSFLRAEGHYLSLLSKKKANWQENISSTDYICSWSPRCPLQSSPGSQPSSWDWDHKPKALWLGYQGRTFTPFSRKLKSSTKQKFSKSETPHGPPRACS